jgi:hypothetical protein
VIGTGSTEFPFYLPSLSRGDGRGGLKTGSPSNPIIFSWLTGIQRSKFLFFFSEHFQGNFFFFFPIYFWFAFSPIHEKQYFAQDFVLLS